MGSTLQLNVLDPSLPADPALFITAAFCIDHKNVRTDNIQCRKKVNHTSAGIDICIFDIADTLDHEQTLFLRKHRLAMLVLEICLIGTDSHIEIPVAGGLHEELHVTAMEKVIASADEYFFVRHDANLS